MGGLLHLVQQGGAWLGCGLAQSPPRGTKMYQPTHERPVYQSPYCCPLLCGFYVAIKGLITGDHILIIGSRIIE